MTEEREVLDSHQVEDKINQLIEECAELKRSMSRLSFVGMGLNKSLDSELANLRNLIKNEAQLAAIKSSIDSISGLLRTLDDDVAKPAKEINQELDLVGLLLDKKLPKELTKELKQVQNKNKGDTGGAEVLRSIANTIADYISDLESYKFDQQSSQPKKGFFASLFSKKQQPEEQPTKPKFDKQELFLPQEVKDSLQHLVEQLSNMDGYSQAADQLKEEIEKVEKIQHLSSILEMITGAFVEISDQEHVQFEKFLKSLNSRIVRVNDFINQTLKFSNQTSKDSRQLNLDLTENFSDMRTSLSDSKTLDDAKTAAN